MVISERVISQVITHQFDSAHDALKTNNTVEISGFGKFLFNNNKAKTKIVNLTNIKNSYENILKEDKNIALKRENFIKSKLSAINLTLNTLKPKIDNNESIKNI